MDSLDRRHTVRTAVIVIILAVVIGVSVFRVPLQTFFVLGIALLCPLMMVGMHAGGHEHGAAPGGDRSPSWTEGRDAPNPHRGGSNAGR